MNRIYITRLIAVASFVVAGEQADGKTPPLRVADTASLVVGSPVLLSEAKALEPKETMKQDEGKVMNQSSLQKMSGTVEVLPGKTKRISFDKVVFVKKMDVRKGQVVTKGEILLVAETDGAHADNYEKAKRDKDFAEKTFKEKQHALHLGEATAEELRAAEKEFQEASKALQGEEDQRSAVKDETVKSPANGIVGEVSVKEGEKVEAKHTILAIIPFDGLAVTFTTTTAAAKDLKKGTPVTINPSEGAPIQGKIAKKTPVVEGKSLSVVTVLVNEKDARNLIPGGTVGVEIGNTTAKAKA